jgi:hypothetical protein
VLLLFRGVRSGAACRVSRVFLDGRAGRSRTGTAIICSGTMITSKATRR